MMRGWRFALVGIIGIVGHASFLFADDQTHSWTAFRQDDGLAHNVVTSVVQASDGAIWFATLDGVSRYNGRTWDTFTNANGLPGHAVFYLFADAHGAVWAAVGNGFDRDATHTIARYQEGRWQSIATSADLFGRFGVRQIHGLQNNEACLVTGDGRLLRYDGQIQAVTREKDEPVTGVQCLMEARDGQVWVAYGGGGRRGGFRFAPGPGGRPRSGSERGIGLLDPATGRWRSFDDGGELDDEVVLAMSEDADGAVWFGTGNSGLRRYDHGQWTAFTKDDGLPSNRIQVIRSTKEGHLWVGTPAGAAFFDGVGWTVYTERDGLPNSFIDDLCIADDGTVWVGTRGGAARFGATGWMHHRNWPGRLDRGGVSLCLDATGGLWAATHERLYRYGDGKWHPMQDLDGLARGRFIGLRVDGQGALWGATAAHALRYDGRIWHSFAPAPSVRLPIRSIAGAATGGIWAVVRSDLYRFDGKEWILEDVDADVLSVYEAPDGALWIGMMEGAARLYKGEMQRFSIDDGLPEGPVTEIASDGRGRIWIGTPLEGVAYFGGTAWTRVADANGAQFNGVERIFPAADGTVWMASSVDGAIHSDGLVTTRYTVREGLPNTQVWDVCQDADGLLWFATADGLACYSPDRDPPETRLLSAPVKVAPYQSALFEFDGQDVWKRTPAWALQYSWRINDSAWTPFSRTGRVLLDTLRAGIHRFEVRAMDQAFNVDPTPVSYAFEVLAPVWLRPWFVALSAISFLALVLTSGYALQRHRRWRAAQTQLIADLEAELQEAHDMQMRLLPRAPVKDGAFEIAGRCWPANHVGGDYFTYFWLDADQHILGFGAADVSGKAMQAAVHAMQLSSIFRYEFRTVRPPRDVLKNLHAVLLEYLDAASFVTCCLGMLDARTGRVHLGNAAHPFPYHYSAATGELRMLELTSVPLGMLLPPGANTDPEEAEVMLEPGDALVLYSDGVTDMQDAAGNFYEENRLEILIRQHAGTGTRALIDAVFDDLRAFKGATPQADDVTLLVICCES